MFKFLVGIERFGSVQVSQIQNTALDVILFLFVRKLVSTRFFYLPRQIYIRSRRKSSLGSKILFYRKINMNKLKSQRKHFFFLLHNFLLNCWPTVEIHIECKYVWMMVALYIVKYVGTHSVSTGISDEMCIATNWWIPEVVRGYSPDSSSNSSVIRLKIVSSINFNGL